MANQGGATLMATLKAVGGARAAGFSGNRVENSRRREGPKEVPPKWLQPRRCQGGATLMANLEALGDAKAVGSTRESAEDSLRWVVLPPLEAEQAAERMV